MKVYILIVAAFVCCSGFYKSFTDIKPDVERLPYLPQQATIVENIEHYIEHTDTIYDAVPDAHLAGLDFEAFYQIERQFFQTLKESSLSRNGCWLNPVITSYEKDVPQLPVDDALPSGPPEGYFDPDQAMFRHHYVQKLNVSPGSRVLLHGDLHGDVHSLVASIAPYMKGEQGFRLHDDHYLIFLGDYADKGLYGLECIYILMRLKIDNPDKVFLVRGNHEDIDIASYYGFQAELTKKGFTQEQIAALYRIYDVLPDALYLGCNQNFVQLCHGGLEIGYLPTKLLNSDGAEYEWLNELNRLEIYSQLSPEAHSEMALTLAHCTDHMIPVAHSTMDSWIENTKCLNTQLGFMWSDFMVDADAPTIFRPRGYRFGKRVTRELLALTNSGQNKLLGIFRAHQHRIDPTDPLMRLLLNLDDRDEENRGIAKLWAESERTGTSIWESIVVTFNLSPGTLFGPAFDDWPGFDFDTLGELVVREQFCDWSLQPLRVIIDKCGDVGDVAIEG